jgi:hypothetical protein
LDRGALQQVAVTEESLNDLLNLSARDLADSKVKGLSTDRRYANAYEAGLNPASYVIRKAGYRVAARAGHHEVTFAVANKLLNLEPTEFLNFFNVARKKRNKVVYKIANVVTENEVEQLIEMVLKFKARIADPSRSADQDQD